ncbi:hypothetical protein TNCV_2025921 [Trichonephila clavipes]|nr:hypothetical protein TNCV_2025921 [Trichonephila clavipes]
MASISKMVPPPLNYTNAQFEKGKDIAKCHDMYPMMGNCFLACANTVHLFAHTLTVFGEIGRWYNTFVHKLLHKSCCCLGVMVSAAGIYTYFVIMAENGFMPQDLMGIRKAWYSRAVNDLKDSYNQEWFGLAIHQNDHQARRRFVEWAQNEIAVVPDFHKRILFSDEAHFWLNGYVNKQNCRIWSEVNPQVYVETPLHQEKLTVWCALWAGRILLQKR